MFNKLVISAATAVTLLLGGTVMTAAPAEAGIHIGFCSGFFCNGGGFGGGYGYGGGYGWHRHHHFGPPPVRCYIQTVRYHHHWVRRRVCQPLYY